MRISSQPGEQSRQADEQSGRERLLIGRQEAARMLSISERAIDYLVANRQLSARRIGTRVLIPLSDLQRFARADHPARLAS